MIFNVYAGLQVALAAVPAGLVYAVLHFGLHSRSATWWAALVGLLMIIPVDLLLRLSNMAEATEPEDEDEEAGPAPGPLALIYPSSGGHLMFLPMYAISGLFTVGLVLGLVKP